MTAPACPPERPVSSPARVFVAAVAVLAGWQVYWIADQTDRLTTVLPSPWSVSFWLAAWTIVACTNTLAAFTARDIHVRVALVAFAAVEAVGVVATLMDQAPMGRQFWPVGQAVAFVACCFGMLAAPLRSPKARP